MDFINCRNVTEDLVDLHLDNCLKSASEMCVCDTCRMDVRCYALNHLPPHYVVTAAGNAYVQAEAMSTQSEADIISAIMHGVNVVRRNPRHK